MADLSGAQPPYLWGSCARGKGWVHAVYIQSQVCRGVAVLLVLTLNS